MSHSPLTLPSLSDSEMEAKFYYAGLPSSPVLVARTGTTSWKAPTGLEAYRKLKDLRPVGNHALKSVWEDNLALELHTLLDSMEVKWTSMDVVRIGDVGESSAPVILWIGVMPASLSANDGALVASKCQELLVRYDIPDVDVEIRESVVIRSGGDGPKLLMSPKWSDHAIDTREPLTTTLGLHICAQSTPWTEGTGGFFITEGGNTERLLLVTARHVVFPSNKNKNEHFEYNINNDSHRHNITLFGDAAFTKYLESIKTEIEAKTLLTGHHEERIRAVEGRDDPEANEERQHAQRKSKEAAESVKALYPFYQDVSMRWAAPESRVLGHVVLSPPINVKNSEGYTEDWAVIEIDSSKIDASNFKGNAIDLGTRIPVDELTLMMRPKHDPWNDRYFKYPTGRLLHLKGTIPDEEMRNPTVFDENDDPCFAVLKRGNATGLTVGRANDILSYARDYSDGEARTSKEWAILPHDSKSGAFSEKGDSGSVIVDGQGRIGGLLTSGAGTTSDLDITYVTPISILLKCMQDSGLHKPNINPVLAT